MVGAAGEAAEEDSGARAERESSSRGWSAEPSRGQPIRDKVVTMAHVATTARMAEVREVLAGRSVRPME
ncbi:hypothetical protein GCM10018779_37120 [Streptomyces griseocarneus]|nr:hypothetical protein GCM10018779_37120 [Streptomyces griseocarneus]